MGLITFLSTKVIIRLSYLTKNNDAFVGRPSVLLKSCIFYPTVKDVTMSYLTFSSYT